MTINKPVSAIIIFIISSILIILFVAPKYQESLDLQDSVAMAQAKYNGKSAYSAQVSALIKDVESRKDALEKVDSALPNQFSFAPLMNFFQKKGVESGLTITKVAFSQISKPQDNQIRNVTFTVNMSGNYQSFKKFLLAMDASARLFEVNAISFSHPAGILKPINQQQTYDFQMEVMTHTY